MIEYGKKLFITKDDDMAEIVGIYPAGQQGKIEHEYTVLYKGVSMRLQEKAVKALFSDEKLDTIKV